MNAAVFLTSLGGVVAVVVPTVLAAAPLSRAIQADATMLKDEIRRSSRLGSLRPAPVPSRFSPEPESVSMTQIRPGFSEQDEKPRVPGDGHASGIREAFGRFVGKPLDAQTVRDLERIAPGRLRVLRPGDVRTMDLVRTRLNVFVDDRNVIRALEYG